MALSTTKTEYYVLSQAIKEASWLRKLLANLNIYSFNLLTPIWIFKDNTGIIKTTENPIENDKIKHYNIRYHFVREKISAGRILFSYIPTRDNLADGLIKSLTKPLHDNFVAGLKLKSV